VSRRVILLHPLLILTIIPSSSASFRTVTRKKAAIRRLLLDPQLGVRLSWLRRPQEVVHAANHHRAPYQENNGAGPLSRCGEVEGSWSPSGCRTNERQDARQHRHHPPERGRRYSECPEHPTAQATLNERNDHNTVDTAVDDGPDTKEQRVASCTLEGKQIWNLGDDPGRPSPIPRSCVSAL
jgi:hypothetical protein